MPHIVTHNNMEPTITKTDEEFVVTNEDGKVTNIPNVPPIPQQTTQEENIDPNIIGATKPVNIKPTVSDTSSAGFQDFLASLNTGVQKSNQEATKKEAESQKSDIQSLIETLGSETALQDQELVRAGADEARRQVDEFTSQLEAEQLSARRKIEKLTKENPRGLFGGALQQEIDRITNESVSKQADIAILQNAALRRYDTAAAIADRKVQAKLEPMRARLESLKFFYEENRDILNKTEDREYKEMIRKEEREYKKQEEAENTVKEIMLTAVQNGADANVVSALSNIDTTDKKAFDEALRVARPYLGNNQVVKLDNGNTIMIDGSGRIIKSFGGGGTTTDVPSTFNALVKTVSGLEDTVTGKKEIADNMNSYLANQDYEGAYNQVANTVEQSLTGTTKTRFADARIDREILSGFRDSIQEYADAGGDVGLLTGSAENISRKLLGVTGDPELTSIAVQLEREFQAYRQAMTGAAFSPAESREYAAVNPTAKKSLNLNLAVIDGAIAQLDNRVDGTITAKVPQAEDLLKVINATDEIQNVKSKVDTIYTNGTPEIRATIESLFNTGQFDDYQVFEYLRAKGMIK